MSPQEHPPAQPHLPLHELFPGIRCAASRLRMGPIPGVAFSRNMIVVRTDAGQVLINPVRLSAQGEEELLADGPVIAAMRLGAFHGRDDAYTLERFGAEFWATPGRQGFDGPPIARQITEDGELPIPGARALVFRKARIAECVIHIPEHRLLITCDSVQHYEKDLLISFMGRLVMRSMGFFTPCVIGPLWLKAATPRGSSLRPDFERILALDFDNLIAGHGTLKRGGAREALRRNVEKLPAPN